MKRLIHTFLLCFMITIFCPYFSWAATVNVDVIHSQDQYQAGGTYPILLRLRISKQWYIHGTAKGESYLIPTILSFEESPSLKVKEIIFPGLEKRQFDYFPNPVEVYSGDILVRATLTVDGDTTTGEHVIKGSLSYQACSSNACLPPEEISINVPLLIVSQSAPSSALNQELFSQTHEKRNEESAVPIERPGPGLWVMLFGIFLGGLALNLTPCVYPLIPITVSYFSGRSKKIGGHTVFHGLVYITGLAFTNSALGVSAALSGDMLGSALQNPAVLIFVACIMIALGLSFFGLWELRIPVRLTAMASKNYGGYFGTFFMGLTLGIVAAPCIGPFILGLLTYVGQLGDPFLGFLCFFVLSIGLGLPLSVLAVFSGSVDRLPRSGDWMIWVKKLMGWVLFAMAGYMISPLTAQYVGRSWILFGLCIAAGIHLGWLDRTGKALRGFSNLKKVLSGIIIGCGLVYLVSAVSVVEGVKWVPYNQDLISDAARDKKPLIIDFYADWCAPCRAMEKRVFTDPEVVKLSRNFVTMRLDLTQRRPFQEEVLQRYRVMGVPTVIFLNKEGVEEKSLRIESLMGKTEVLDRMKRALDRSPSRLGK